MKLSGFNPRKMFFPRVLAGVIGIIFLTAGILKALDMELFMRQIRDYGIITSPFMITVGAWGGIITEFVLGAALLVYYRPKITIFLSVVLFCVFIGAVLWALITGVTDDCGCFGSWVKRSPGAALIEDLFMLAVLLCSWPPRYYREKSGAFLKLLIIFISLSAGITLPLCFSSNAKEIIGYAGGKGSANAALFSIKGLDDINIKNSSFLFVLLSTDCLHCRDSVGDFNDLARNKDFPEIIAITSDEQELIDSFKKELKPAFTIRKITEDEFYRLLGMGSTPKSFLVVKGHVIKTWDEEVPTGAAVGELAKKSDH
jgi:hypothetical protein